MNKESLLQAFLNPRQIENLCKRFGKKIEELEPVFEGWHKRIYMSKEEVYIFPREPPDMEPLEKEMAIYREFRKMKSVKLPQLIERVEDKGISYYPFGVITRIKGVQFSSKMEKMEIKELGEFLKQMARIIAEYHEMKEFPKSVEVFEAPKEPLSPANTMDYLLWDSPKEEAAENRRKAEEMVNIMIRK